MADQADETLIEWRLVVAQTLGLVGRRPLTFDQVLRSREPAVFEHYGEHILYLDGRLYLFGDADNGAGLRVCPARLDASCMEQSVGLEFGWQHAEACECEYCAVAEDELAVDTTDAGQEGQLAV